MAEFRSVPCLASTILRITSTGAMTQARRSPGARVFEKVLRYITLPVVAAVVGVDAIIDDHQRWQMFALVAELAIRIIFDDGHTVSIGQLNKVIPPFQTQG